MSKGEKQSMSFQDFAWTCAGIGLAFVVVWLLFGEQMYIAMVHVRNETLRVLELVWPRAHQVRSQLINLVNGGPGATFNQFITVSTLTGEVVKWLWMPLACIVAGAALMMGNTLDKYRRRLTIEQLMEQEMEIWPEITPIVGLNLNKGDIRKGPWRVEMNEVEFAEKHRLLKDGQIDLFQTRQIFVKQLGPRWKGPMALPPYSRAIYAACALAITGQRKTAIEKLRDMSRQHGSGPEGSHKKIDFSWADKVVAETIENPVLVAIGGQHAYARTVMATMLQAARKGGIFPTSWFIWLRPLDRELFGILNAAGRYTAFSEYAGIFGHWLFEKEIGKPSIAPQVDEAIVGLKEALENFKAPDDPIRALIK